MNNFCVTRAKHWNVLPVGYCRLQYDHKCKQLYAEFISICIRRQWRRQCSGIVSNNAAFFLLGSAWRPIYRVRLSVTYALLRTFRKPVHLTCLLDNGRHLHSRSGPNRLYTGPTFTSRSCKELGVSA